MCRGQFRTKEIEVSTNLACRVDQLADLPAYQHPLVLLMKPWKISVQQVLFRQTHRHDSCRVSVRWFGCALPWYYWPACLPEEKREKQSNNFEVYDGLPSLRSGCVPSCGDWWTCSGLLEVAVKTVGCAEFHFPTLV